MLDLKSANSNNLWSFYQKFFLFEEPAFKWTNIAKAARHLDFNYLHQCFASFNADKANSADPESANPSVVSLVNILIAFEEGSCFQTAYLEKLASLDMVNTLPQSRVDYWQKLTKTTEPLARLITLAEIYSPNWQQIATQLPADDARIIFIEECCSRIDANKTDWQKQNEIFQQCLQVHRHKLPANFLPTALVLVEGITERILLPYFAQICNVSLLNKGVLILPAGGANQIARKYIHWQESLKLPIFCLFDHDAGPVAQSVLPKLRDCDAVYVLADGEIEDLMPLEFLVNRVNHYLSCDPLHDVSKPVLLSDFHSGEKRTLVLEKIWRQKELGKFEKVKFAQFVANQSDNIGYHRECISKDCKQMLAELSKALNSQKMTGSKGITT